jgi:hypothetical protein
MPKHLMQHGYNVPLIKPITAEAQKESHMRLFSLIYVLDYLQLISNFLPLIT